MSLRREGSPPKSESSPTWGLKDHSHRPHPLKDKGSGGGECPQRNWGDRDSGGGVLFFQHQHGGPLSSESLIKCPLGQEPPPKCGGRTDGSLRGQTPTGGRAGLNYFVPWLWLRKLRSWPRACPPGPYSTGQFPLWEWTVSRAAPRR